MNTLTINENGKERRFEIKLNSTIEQLNDWADLDIIKEITKQKDICNLKEVWDNKQDDRWDTNQPKEQKVLKNMLLKIIKKFGARETLLALGDFKDVPIEYKPEEECAFCAGCGYPKGDQCVDMERANNKKLAKEAVKEVINFKNKQEFPIVFEGSTFTFELFDNYTLKVYMYGFPNGFYVKDLDLLIKAIDKLKEMKK